MKAHFAVPSDLTPISHLESAITSSGIIPDEILLWAGESNSTEAWIRGWASSHQCAIRHVSTEQDLFRNLGRNGDGVIVAVISPDHPATLDLVARAESQRIPVYVYRELYRQDPRINCRFSPVERPDVWLRALTAEQGDFFRHLHTLCHQYGVNFKTNPNGDASVLQFSDGTKFEGLEITPSGCRVRPRGSIRYRKIRLD